MNKVASNKMESKRVPRGDWASLAFVGYVRRGIRGLRAGKKVGLIALVGGITGGN